MYNIDNNSNIYIEQQTRIPGFAMSYNHFHNYCEVFFLKTGSCIYSINDIPYHLSAGDILIIAPGDSHSTRYEGLVPCKRTVIYFMPDVLPETFWNNHGDIRDKFLRSGKVLLDKKGQEQLEPLLSFMLGENNIPDEYSYELLQLQLMIVLLNLQRNGIFVYEKIDRNNRIDHDIEEALRYIALNFSMPILLEDVAAEINLTPNYLSKKFKRVTGTTFKEYVNYIRIRQASQMLLTTDDSITKIALNCGFNSSNYFKDCFRRINGVSPRTFRKQSKSYTFEHDDDNKNTD